MRGEHREDPTSLVGLEVLLGPLGPSLLDYGSTFGPLRFATFLMLRKTNSPAQGSSLLYTEQRTS
jgi:hypothetical protein